MEQYIVIAKANSTAPNFEDCQIIKEGTKFDEIHNQVFGPASEDECKKWIADNCSEEPGGEKTEIYIVAALAVSLPAKNEQCTLLKEGDVIIATHSKVFGPASKEDCEKWITENCGGEPIPKFIVIAMSASLPKYEDCSVIKEDAVFPATHSKVFGPASEDECKKWVVENCVEKSAPVKPDEPPLPSNDRYIVTSLASSLPARYEQCNTVKYGDVFPATRKIVFGPDSQEECERWREARCGSEVNEKDPRWIYLYYLQYGLIALVTLSFVGIFWYGIYKELKWDDQQARGMITFLVAVSTVGIATLAILSAMVLRDFKERFDSAKQVLAVLVGILGTIVGFYFGQANNANTNTTQDVKIAELQISPSPVVRDKETISFNLTDGKPPYQYKIIFKQDSVQPKEKTGDSETGEISEEFDMTAVPPEVKEIDYSIEGKDKDGKSFEYNKDRKKKIPLP